jgi:hypothetical protein
MALTDKLARPGLLQRAASAVAYAITGVSGDTFMSPMNPLHPMAEGTKGRAWDYPVAYNINYIPRSNEPINFPKLKQIAEYGITREVIQTRIDQMCSLEWMIRPKEMAKGKRPSSGQASAKVKEITTFLEYPDKRLDWTQWLNGVLEQHFVYDGVAIYRQKTRGGDPYSFTGIDVATLKVLIDADGRAHPPAPSPAYQQILKGVPTANYTAFSANDGPVFTRGEMMYVVKNQRIDRAYGFPPGAQIIDYVEMTLARAREQLSEFTHGNSPQGLIQAPENFTAADINAAQLLWDSVFAGNIEERRRLWWVPHGSDYKAIDREILFDSFDEWLARVICFAFSISPAPFIKQMNRATQESAQETALAEGLQPTMKFVAKVMNRIIAQDFKAPELEFAWVEDIEFDPAKKAIIDNTYGRIGALSLDEVREGIGRDPLGGAFSKPMFATPSGWVPVDPEEAQALKPPPAPFGGSGGPAQALPGAKSKDQGTGKLPPGKKAPKSDANAAESATEDTKKNVGRSLYVHRALINADSLHKWAGEQGISGLLDPEDMHVTQIFCRDPIDWDAVPKDANHTLLVEGDKRALDQFNLGALVLKIDSPELNARFGELTGAGASHSFDDYHAHVTLGYDCKIAGMVGEGDQAKTKSLGDIKPYDGPLIFGEEVWREISDDWQKVINKVTGAEVDEAASHADPDPSAAQIASGNYSKGHIDIQGLKIAIENAKDSQRSGTSPDGSAWSVTMPAHYGYLKRSEGADGDQVDVYIGPNPESDKVWVLDQADADTGAFDEHKCFIGYDSWKEACADYLKAFSDGKGALRIGGAVSMSMDQFKGWLKEGDTTKPITRKSVSGSPLDDHRTNVPTPDDPREGNASYGIGAFDPRQYTEEPPDYQQKAAKRDKADVEYSSGKPQAHCSICKHFKADAATSRAGTCELVEGVIDGNAWCELFAKEPGLAKIYHSVSELPEAVTTNLKSPRKRRQWMTVWNSIYADTKDEARAYAGAWSAVKKSDHDHYAYF